MREVKTIIDAMLAIHELRLENAVLMCQVYCEYNGVPDEVVNADAAQMVEWAEKPETRERVGIDRWLEDY